MNYCIEELDHARNLQHRAQDEAKTMRQQLNHLEGQTKLDEATIERIQVQFGTAEQRSQQTVEQLEQMNSN